MAAILGSCDRHRVPLRVAHGDEVRPKRLRGTICLVASPAYFTKRASVSTRQRAAGRALGHNKPPTGPAAGSYGGRQRSGGSELAAAGERPRARVSRPAASATQKNAKKPP